MEFFEQKVVSLMRLLSGASIVATPSRQFPKSKKLPQGLLPSFQIVSTLSAKLASFMTNIALSVQLDAAIEHTFALVDQARDRSFRAANTETVHLYGAVGQYLSRKCQFEGLG